MQVSIDDAGRVVIPKAVRDELGLSPDIKLDLEVVDGHLELSAPFEAPAVVRERHGPSFAPTGKPIGDREVRHALEAARERR
jgi:AbrB family looped-hinge helix DNA binding protein